MGPKLIPIFRIGGDIVNYMQRIALEKWELNFVAALIVLEQEISKFKKLGHCHLDWKGSRNSPSQTSLAPSFSVPLRRSACKTSWNLIGVLNVVIYVKSIERIGHVIIM
jgi:hypothetical protein